MGYIKILLEHFAWLKLTLAKLSNRPTEVGMAGIHIMQLQSIRGDVFWAIAFEIYSIWSFEVGVRSTEQRIVLRFAPSPPFTQLLDWMEFLSRAARGIVGRW